MKRLAILFMICILPFGCGAPPDPDPEPSPSAPRNDGDEADAPGAGVMAGDIVLRLFDEGAANGEPRRPTFTVSSPDTSRTGEGLWAFREAEATIRARDGTVYLLEAGEGQFDEEGRRALLGGGVVLTGPDVYFEMDSVVWENDSRAARSDGPLNMEASGMRLRAESMVLYPDDDHLELEAVSGSIDLRSIPES